MGKAIVAAAIDIAVLGCPQPSEAAEPRERGWVYARRGWAGVRQINVTGAWPIRVFNRIQVHTLGPVVLDGHDEIAFHLMLEDGAPEMRIRGLDIRIYVSEAEFWQCLRARRTSQRARVVCSDGNGTAHITGQDRNDRISRRILDNVKCHIAKVAFVRDAPASAQGSFAIAE